MSYGFGSVKMLGTRDENRARGVVERAALLTPVGAKRRLGIASSLTMRANGQRLSRNIYGREPLVRALIVVSLYPSLHSLRSLQLGLITHRDIAHLWCYTYIDSEIISSFHPLNFDFPTVLPSGSVVCWCQRRKLPLNNRLHR